MMMAFGAFLDDITVREQNNLNEPLRGPPTTPPHAWGTTVKGHKGQLGYYRAYVPNSTTEHCAVFWAGAQNLAPSLEASASFLAQTHISGPEHHPSSCTVLQRSRRRKGSSGRKQREGISHTVWNPFKDQWPCWLVHKTQSVSWNWPDPVALFPPPGKETSYIYNLLFPIE